MSAVELVDQNKGALSIDRLCDLVGITPIGAMNDRNTLALAFGSTTHAEYPWQAVPEGQARVPMSFHEPDESDPGPIPSLWISRSATLDSFSSSKKSPSRCGKAWLVNGRAVVGIVIQAPAGT